MTKEHISQIAIFVFGVTAIFLSQSMDPQFVRWSSIFGLASQPFFIYSTVRAKQWGMFVLTLFYCVAWMSGVNNHWLHWL